MFTSGTNSIWRGFLYRYGGSSLFLFLFSRIYEAFSFGETSLHMHWLWLPPLIGGLISYLIYQTGRLHRLSYNLWNSAIAVFTSGFLFRGIVNLSGRSTTYDQIYWIVALLFALFTAISLLFRRKSSSST